MKVNLLLSVFLCPTLLSLSAQSFVDLNNAWSIVDCSNFGGCTSLYYMFIGDSSIDGRTYHKLYTSSSPDMTDVDLVVMMREDSDHVVYAYQDTSEFVYYDMDMIVGDSIIVRTNHCPWPITFGVQSIDNVTLLNGEQRRPWHLASEWSLTDEWIEGIGSIAGPFSYEVIYCTSDIFWYQNCFTQNDTLKWQVFPSCDYNRPLS